jgi:CTP synthase (UTP-ammonia lyase)
MFHVTQIIRFIRRRKETKTKKKESSSSSSSLFLCPVIVIIIARRRRLEDTTYRYIYKNSMMPVDIVISVLRLSSFSFFPFLFYYSQMVVVVVCVFTCVNHPDEMTTFFFSYPVLPAG